MDQFQKDLASLLIRIQQINDEKEPEHFLWDRVMTCDMRRMKTYLTPETEEKIKEIVPQFFIDEE